jgi:putative transposase
LYSRGLSVRDVQAHLREIYGVEVSTGLISQVTDAVMDDARAWQQRPLEDVYPVLFLDAFVVKIRDGLSVQRRACYLALGVSMDGSRDVLGVWFQATEGAKFWMQVLSELKQRGVRDILICCVDGLKGFPDAIEAIFPDTTVQTCIVHLIRASLKYVPRRDYDAVVKDLKPIYTAVNAEAAEHALETFDQKWGGRLPVITQAWRDSWEYVIPFLAYEPEVRRVIYTTDERFKSRRSGCGVRSPGVRLRSGRGRPPSEAQVLGLMPAAQLAPQRAFSVASRWRRPRPVSRDRWLASRRPAGDTRSRLVGRARVRAGGLL